jgi:hypothetical protein
MPQSQSDPKTVRMRKIEIIDNQGFGERLVAGSYMAPTDWTGQGMAVWPKHTNGVPCKPTPSFVLGATSPDQTAGVQIFPGETWLWSANPAFAQQLRAQQNSTHVVTHCEVRPLMTAVEYLKGMIAKENSIQVISSSPLPDADKLARMIAETNARAQQQAGPNAVHVEIDTARLYLHGNSGGKPSEGYIETTIFTTYNQTPMGAIIQVSIPFVANRFAPLGKLKEMDKLLATIINTATVNPQWQQRVDQFQAGLQRIQQNINTDDANTSRNIARIQQGANNYAYNVIRGVQRNSQKSVDSSAHAFALSMNDTQEYHDPATGQTVLGSNQYNHVFSNGQGEYIYSNSPSYNPSASEHGNWQEMKPR